MEDIQITSEIKQKNPRRVEQGKRLAAISKEAKERKARERLLAEEELEKDNSSSISKYIVVGLILVGAGTYYVYVKYKSKRSEHRSQSQSQSEQKQPPKKVERSEKLVNLFD